MFCFPWPSVAHALVRAVSRHISTPSPGIKTKRSHVCERGTHECVRYRHKYVRHVCVRHVCVRHVCVRHI